MIRVVGTIPFHVWFMPTVQCVSPIHMINDSSFNLSSLLDELFEAKTPHHLVIGFLTSSLTQTLKSPVTMVDLSLSRISLRVSAVST